MVKTRALRGLAIQVLRLGLLPGVVYFALFIWLTNKLLSRFFTRLWTVSQDGYQALWSLWWVNHALTNLHQQPWYTPIVEYPLGAWLWGHSLMLFNGLVGIVLLRFLNLVSVYNALVLLGFIASGVTTFWLCYYLTRSTLASLVGGFLFTFSHYHFAHVLSHLDLVSTEWIPLYLLCWYAALQRASWKWSVGAAFTLLLVLETHAYYFFYCALASLLMLGWFAIRKRDLLFIFRSEYRRALAGFAGVTLVLIAPRVGAFLWVYAQSPFVGHDPAANALDLMALFMPARVWRFHASMQPYWVNWNGNMSETNVALPLAALAVAVGVWLKRQALGARDLPMWYGLFLIFGVLALGPELRINGAPIVGLPLPYALLEMLLPPVRSMGVPARMVVISILALAVINAYGFRALLRAGWRQRILAVVLFGLIVFESLPATIPTISPAIPAYVTALRDLPFGAVLDTVGLATAPGIPPGQVMYYQTVHQKPIAFGYLSREPAQITQQNARILGLLALQDFSGLCNEFGIRYLVVNDQKPLAQFAGETAYKTDDVRILDLASAYSLSQPGSCSSSR